MHPPVKIVIYLLIKKFFNLNIESSKEIIFILTDISKKQQIIDAVVEAGKLKEPGTGILFTMPVMDIIGLHHRISIKELSEKDKKD